MSKQGGNQPEIVWQLQADRAMDFTVVESETQSQKSSARSFLLGMVTQKFEVRPAARVVHVPCFLFRE